MQKKKYLIVFGAVFVIILLVSSASAINFVQFEKKKNVSQIKNDDTKNGVHIDPNICMTYKQLPLLKKGVGTIRDKEVRLLVQEIIKRIEINGNIYSNDIREIITTFHINVKEVIGFSWFQAEYCGGEALVFFWGFIRTFFAWGVPKIGFSSMVLFHARDTGEPIKLYINGHYYTTEIKGVIFGFLGSVYNNLGPKLTDDFGLKGLGLLAIIS